MNLNDKYTKSVREELEEILKPYVTQDYAYNLSLDICHAFVLIRRKQK